MQESYRADTPLAIGTLTLLFTDIEGSSRAWEKEPERMKFALARHDAISRTAVESHRGTLIKMTGDGMYAAFDDARDALDATLELQQALADPDTTCGLPLRVRCGLHAGVVERRDNDYFGSPVNRAARIMSAAHGGQVLLSQAVVDRLQDVLPALVALRDLGNIRLKDLAMPEHVWQAVHPRLRQDFPALRSLEATPNNLPQQPTSFIGRGKEQAELERLLAKSRLLTLTGSGGCGKTRLVLQVAADTLEQYPDGAWLVEFAPLSDPGLVPQTIATALGLKEETGELIARSLTEYLKDKRLLLLLDNCEHLLDACAMVADAILRQCPGVQILASSREALGIAGEQSYRVPSLSLPDPKQGHTAGSVAPFEAVQLFRERALLGRPDFAITERNAAAVASICYRLDGIPLALELAAARVRTLTPEEIDGKLHERFRLLTGGSRAALPRQQTLRSLIDWSYELLNEPARRLLQRLSVFAGGWTLEAAERVCAGDGVEPDDILDLLTSLADKSLAIAEPLHERHRYRLLETVRQYARERMQESGGGETARIRHREFFLAVAEEAESHLTGSDQTTWLQRLEDEHENLRAALEWSAADADPAKGLQLCGALQRFWYTRGYFNEGRTWCALFLARPGAQTPTRERAKALRGAGWLAREQCDYAAARALLEEGLALGQALEDPRGVAHALHGLGGIAREQGDFEKARERFAGSLELYRDAGDRHGVAAALNSLGLLARELGDYPAARRLYEESLAIDRELGDRRSIAVSLNNLGGMACDQCDFATARALHEESLAIKRELGDRLGIASSLTNLGDIAHETGDYVTARALLEESLAMRRELGDRRGIAISMSILGSVALDQGDCVGAQALYDKSLAMQRALGDRWGVAASLNYLGNLACEQDNPTVAQAYYEESVGISRELGDRWALVDSLAGLANVTLTMAGPGRAARIWGGAERLREELSAPLRSNERARYDHRIAAARAASGNSAVFDIAWQEGRALSLEEALALALEERAAPLS